MESEEYLKYAKDLLKIALHKTHDIDHAADLVQETYLYFLIEVQKGNSIDDCRTYLLSILNNRFFISLREKYRMPLATYGVLPIDMVDENCNLEEMDGSSTIQAVRRELAFLSKIYREVMVRYYMNRESVEHIANELNIPKGTVLSRLDIGRKKMKKEIKKMKNYAPNCYQPEILNLGITGRCGQKGEPFCCIINDSLKQNILLSAYEKLLTIEDISSILATPMPFIEDSVNYLAANELMKKIGTKYGTAFVITDYEESKNNVNTSKEFVDETFEKANEIFLDAAEKYKEIDCFKKREDTYLYMLAVLSISIGCYEKLFSRL